MSCEIECVEEFCLNPGVRGPVCVDYSDPLALPDGEAPVSGVVTAINLTDDSDATLIVLDNPATVTVSGTDVQFVMQHGGTSGKAYRVELILTTTSGYTYTTYICIKAL
jgi:hypothetical protein